MAKTLTRKVRCRGKNRDGSRCAHRTHKPKRDCGRHNAVSAAPFPVVPLVTLPDPDISNLLIAVEKSTATKRIDSNPPTPFLDRATDGLYHLQCPTCSFVTSEHSYAAARQDYNLHQCE